MAYSYEVVNLSYNTSQLKDSLFTPTVHSDDMQLINRGCLHSDALATQRWLLHKDKTQLHSNYYKVLGYYKVITHSYKVIIHNYKVITHSNKVVTDNYTVDYLQLQSDYSQIHSDDQLL